jgi:hypothetical protein
MQLNPMQMAAAVKLERQNIPTSIGMIDQKAIADEIEITLRSSARTESFGKQANTTAMTVISKSSVLIVGCRLVRIWLPAAAGFGLVIHAGSLPLKG